MRTLLHLALSALALVVVAACSACTQSGAWNLPAPVRAVGPAPFRSDLVRATATWDAALVGCATGFSMATDGDATAYPVTLIAEDRWTDSEPDGKGGIETDEGIDVRAWPVERGDYVPVLLHELGHALGLGHVDPNVDMYSVMKPALGTLHQLSAGDVRRAREVLGCPP